MKIKREASISFNDLNSKTQGELLNLFGESAWSMEFIGKENSLLSEEEGASLSDMIANAFFGGNDD